ncbi:monovalent cation/H(+) antiporter subunit G [Parvibaculum sp. MBR-TMA-1.3b-4.2]|jgi:multicomponent Na+:H+ antiporter subunit G
MDMSLLDLACNIATGIAFATGSFFLLVGAFGIVRLPDFWSRLHAAGVIDTAGAEIILIGMMFQTGWDIATLKLILIAFLLFITSPTATHAVSNAAFVAGLRPQDLKKDETAQTLSDVPTAAIPYRSMLPESEPAAPSKSSSGEGSA